MNFPGELFPPTPMNFMDSTMFAFQQRLQELVGRRDTKMAEKIDGLLREQSPDKRYFFAVGFSKRNIFISRSNEIHSFLFSSSNGCRWDCCEIETRLSVFNYTSM